MPIITAQEVRDILQISTTDTTVDFSIAKLIPLVQKKVVRYCNNSFLNYNIQYEASTLAFVSSAPASITDSDSGFLESFFSVGDYKIFGSKLNDKIVSVLTVAAGSLTLADDETLIDEAAENSILITKVEFPEDIKIPVATMISYLMKQQGKFVTSESLPGGYSATYKDEKDIMSSLFREYRKP